MKTYLVKPASHIYPAFILAIGAIVGCLLYYYSQLLGGKPSLIITLLALLSIGPILNLVLHIQYFVRNGKVKIEIDEENELLFIRGVKYNFSDIERIEFHQNFSGVRRKGYRLPSDQYFYRKIIFRQKSVIYITSLLIEENPFKVPDTEIQRFIPFIK